MDNNKYNRKLLKRRSISINTLRIQKKKVRRVGATISDQIDAETQGSSFEKVTKPYESDTKLVEDYSDNSSTFEDELALPTAIKTIVITNKATQKVHIEDSSKKLEGRCRRTHRRLKSSYNVRSNLQNSKNQKILQDFLPVFKSNRNTTIKLSATPGQSNVGMRIQRGYEELPIHNRIIQFQKPVKPKIQNFIQLSKVQFQDSTKYQKFSQGTTKPSISCRLTMSKANRMRCAKTRSSNRFRIPAKKLKKDIFCTPQKALFSTKYSIHEQNSNTSCKNTEVSDSGLPSTGFFKLNI
ncbi:unnamed protein product [Moneuplotes crassus]|uniref:Uncharacterized protein n=1 Tax=Euplotes crassus TaxID=5936 RepID=A0AAD1UH15_EUPCR|nr:unnamed protein product [Moneuplotes crassus]